MRARRADERSADIDEQSVDDPAERALTRRAAVAGTVLLRNVPITRPSGGDHAAVLEIAGTALAATAASAELGPVAICLLVPKSAYKKAPAAAA